MQNSKKLLLRLSSAGDVLLTSPLLKLIKEREPGSEIHFVVKSQFADLIRSNPNVNRLHIVHDHPEFHHLENLRRELVAEKFDVTLDLHNNFRTVYLRRGTAPKIRVIGKDILKRFVLVNSRLNLYSTVRPVALKYAQTYDKSLQEVSRPEIFFPDSVVNGVDAVWRSLGPESSISVFLCPGARHFTKRWPVEYWTALAGTLSQQSRIVLLGGIADVEACNEIQKETNAVNFCNKFSLLESAAMLRHASVVVTNDSYLMHAANALGKKTVAIFGSSVKEFGFFPYDVENKVLEVRGLPCRPCSHVGLESCPRQHFKCMKETLPDKVEAAVRAMLES